MKNNRRLIKWLALVACGILAAPNAPAVLNDDHDPQLKIELTGGGKLGAGFDAGIQETLTYGNGMTDFFEQQTFVFAGWQATPWLKLGFGVGEVQVKRATARYVRSETKEGDEKFTQANDHYWSRESRPRADVTFSQTPWGWKISDRNRFEWRDKEGRGPYLRYRNRLQCAAPWKWTSWNIQPQASVEINYEDDDKQASSDRLNRARWLIGATMKPLQQMQIAPAIYLEQNKKNGTWTDLLVLQLGATWNF